MDRLPFGALPGNVIAANAEDTIRRLADKRILNLTGMSNTDVKLAYGTANLPILSEYDANYTELVTTLENWSRELFEEGLYPEALQVLTFAVEIRTDISHSWHLYIECVRFHAGYDPEECRRILRGRLAIAKSLESLSREGILKELNAAIEG